MPDVNHIIFATQIEYFMNEAVFVKKTALFGVGKHDEQYCDHLNEPTSKSTVASACPICFLMVRPQKKVEQ